MANATRVFASYLNSSEVKASDKLFAMCCESLGMLVDLLSDAAAIYPAWGMSFNSFLPSFHRAVNYQSDICSFCFPFGSTFRKVSRLWRCSLSLLYSLSLYPGITARAFPQSAPSSQGQFSYSGLACYLGRCHVSRNKGDRKSNCQQ